jgi:hypothetical protein
MQVKCYKRIKIECENTSRKDGFNHRAKLYIDGDYERKDICQYFNRTWEKFTYHDVMKRVIRNSKILSDAEKQEAAEFFKLNHFNC